MKALHIHCLAVLLLAMSSQTLADRLADPTRPPQASRGQDAEMRPGVRVEAILRSADRRLAIVNGRIVRAGDNVNGMQVEEILVDGIRYMRDGQTHIVRLRPAAMPVRLNDRRERAP
jgi:MSHA biogenesis protein MshK